MSLTLDTPLGELKRANLSPAALLLAAAAHGAAAYIWPSPNPPRSKPRLTSRKSPSC